MSLTLAEIKSLLEHEQAAKSRPQLKREFFENFYEPCAYLLDLDYPNLFELIGEIHEFVFRCKGCGDRVPGYMRALHHREHKREYAKVRD